MIEGTTLFNLVKRIEMYQRLYEKYSDERRGLCQGKIERTKEHIIECLMKNKDNELLKQNKMESRGGNNYGI